MSQDSYKLTWHQFKWVFFPQHGYLSPCCCFIVKLCPILVTLWTVAGKAPLSMGFSRPEYRSGQPFPSPGDFSQPRDRTEVSHTLQADSLPAEPQGKPKNIGVSSLSLLQRIFPTKESNQCLLHCRCILYQPSYEGSPLRVWNAHQLVDIAVERYGHLCFLMSVASVQNCSERRQRNIQEAGRRQRWNSGLV